MAARRYFCRYCDQPVEVVGKLSKRGICHDCGQARQVEATLSMATGKGEVADKWRAGLARAAGVPQSKP